MNVQIMSSAWYLSIWDHLRVILLYAITLKFSERMISFLARIACITKPQLFNRKMCLVSKETAVLTQYAVFLVTITHISRVWAWAGHPACARTTAGWRSSPVIHFDRIPWHPPSKTTSEELWITALITDKLFAVWRDSGETRRLRKTRSGVMNISWVTARALISLHMCSTFAVVTDDCHANSILVTHITVNCKRCKRTLAIGINDVISTCSTDLFSYYRTRSHVPWIVNFYFGFNCCQSISCSTSVRSFVWFLDAVYYQCSIL